ncbi:MAG: hypothetical protein KDA20_08200 [Phycisphaerales bacterium]|nr:hypothetical protein [Phycisphaerales bacterium]
MLPEMPAYVRAGSPGMAGHRARRIDLDLDRVNVTEAADLRRRRRRELAEVLVEHAQFILPMDRALIESIYRDGQTAQHVGALNAISPRAVRRRIRQLTERLLSPRFAYVLQHREQWPTIRRRIAVACALQGRTMRETSRHLRVSLHTVRKEMGIVDALLDAQSRQRA